jgi:hypothetical protein
MAVGSLDRVLTDPHLRPDKVPLEAPLHMCRRIRRTFDERKRHFISLLPLLPISSDDFVPASVGFLEMRSSQ